jgi:outer membrane protein W
VLFALAPGARAEEIEKKFRIGVSIGGAITTDAEKSPSANRRTLFDANGEVFDFIYDPRNDSASFSNFSVGSAYGLQVSGSYAFTRNWYLEANAGYHEATVGNVEVQAQFDNAPLPNLQSFGFRIFNLDGGNLKQIPIQLTAGYRFRPKASFNPYVGIGVGYLINEYSPSAEINELSRNLEASLGAFRTLEGTGQGGENFSQAGTPQSLTGIKVEAPDSAEYHLSAGFEVTFKRRWVVFLDASYSVYSSNFRMTVNGADQLGVSVPADQVVITQPGALGPFGTVNIATGGLIDGGSLVPELGAPPGTDCTVSTSNCELTGPADGIPDPGDYYVHAGTVKYNALSIMAGVKFTF